MRPIHKRDNARRSGDGNARSFFQRSARSTRPSRMRKLGLVVVAFVTVGVLATGFAWARPDLAQTVFRGPLRLVSKRIFRIGRAVPAPGAKGRLQATSANTITSVGTAFTENFDGIGSTTTATLPTGWKVDSVLATPTTVYSLAATATTQAAGTSGAGILTSVSSGGTYNFANGVTASSTDRAAGWLTSTSYTSPRQLFLQVTNNTGLTVNSLSITYDIEKYRSGTRAFDINFFSGTDGIVWTAQTAGDQSFAADLNNTTVSNPPATTSKSVTISGLSIANGANYYLRWSYTGNLGSSNGQGLGIDNFSVTANVTASALKFRSAASGNWSANATWEMSTDGTTWIAATQTPTSANDTITIRNGHTVTVSANVNADQLTVDSGGTLAVSSGITLTVDDGTGTDLTVNGTANVNGTGVIGGAGSFNLASGATLGIGSAAGITSSGASGSIQVTGTRSFSTSANYIYNGSAAQVTGNGLPATVSSLTINNSAGVTLSANVSVTNALTITSGTFSQGAAFDVSAGSVSVASGATWQNFGTGDLTLGGNVSNAGTITFNGNGTSCGDLDDILIRSSVGGTQRTWSGAGTFSMTDVDVQDQRTPVVPPPVAIVVTSGTNSGNNTGWAFSGTCTAGSYVWTGALSTDWQIAANWSPTRALPAQGDVLVIDGDATPSPIITNVPSQTIAALRVLNFATPTLSASAVLPPQTLTLSGATGTDLSVPVGSRLTLAGANALKLNVASGSTGIVGGQIIVQDAAHRLLGNAAGAITFQSGALFTTSTGFTGNAFGSGAGGDGVAGSVIFASGSVYSHNAGGSPFGASGNPSVVTFQTGSVARYFTASGFDANGRTYANLEIGQTDPNGVAVTASDSGTGNFQFDNLNINSTGSANSSLTFTGSGASTITIQGNVTSTGAGNGAVVSDLTLISSSGIVIAKTVAGMINFTNSGGSVRTVSFGNATANSGNATVVTGNTLALGRKLIVDTGSVITVDGALTHASTTGYVIGKEKRAYTGAAAFTYHLGTANGYSPLDASITAGTGDLTASARQGAQPVVDSTKSLQRYWTLTEGGAITADLTFHYLDPTDIMGTEANYRLIVVEGSNATAFPNNCPNSPCVDPPTNTIKRTGVQTFSDWTAGAPSAPTAVKLTGFTALDDNGHVMLQWQSGYEAHNLGYNIYREEDGKRVQITPSLVAGSALIAGQQTRLTAGLSYTWVDESGEKAKGSRQKAERPDVLSPVTYWLEDVDLDGTRTLHGPIAVAQCVSAKADCKEISERSPLIGEVGNAQDMRAGRPRSQYPRSQGVQFNSWPADAPDQEVSVDKGPEIDPIGVQRDVANMPGVKIATSRAGWYRVTKPQLQAAGLDTKEAALLQLYANGREVAIRVSGNNDEFTDADSVEFYGQGLDSPTDAAQTYYLVVGKSAGKRLGAVDSNILKPSGAHSFAYTIERKERMIYFSGLLNGDDENFFGQIVRTTPASAVMPVRNLDPASTAAGTPAQLAVSLQGVTKQAHLVQVTINGTDLGTMSFANTAHPQQSFAVPASALHDGDNTVQLTSLGGGADFSLVDTLRLTYDHAFIADNNALSFSLSTRETRRVTGFTNQNIHAVDITDPLNSMELKASVQELSPGNFSADVQVPQAGGRTPHRVLMLTDDAAATADRLLPNEPSSLWSETAGADYVIVTTHDLQASVEPLAQLRRNQGMVVKVVDIEDLYDEFTYGKHAPQAIHDYLARAVATWTRQPHYALFAGDASYDPKNYFNAGFNDLVPTKLIDAATMETASDDWLADFNGDGMAELALGRLPARTVAQANTMIGKIVAYENAAADPSRGALLVADTSFEAPSSAVASLLPAGMPVTTVNRSSADDATIHSQIITAINQGPLVTNYVGHGSNGVWTGASLLSNNDAPSLGNTSRLSVFTMMTCFNGFFQDAQNDSLSEALLKSQGGAVAVWASTTLTDPAGQNVIDQEFYRQLFGAQPATLGDAARTAKVTTTDADVRRTWTLFGDPAMRLR